MNPPRTIAEYLEQLRAALRGADPALIQDALYDAEEHLRAELAEHPSLSEAEMLAKVVGSYGAPEEVAEIYRDQEIKIQRALRPPPPKRQHSALGRFFGVAADPRTYGAMFYAVLALATGIFYFTWAVVGLSLSAGLSVLIIGIPFFLLFLATVRMLSLVEGRIVESMLGVRMPRRPPYPVQGLSLMKRIGAMLGDGRTWTTLLYMLLMLPLGIVYFTMTITLISIAVAFIGAPLLRLLDSFDIWGVHWQVCSGPDWLCYGSGWMGALVLCPLGIALLFATLHLLRGFGRAHGQIAKHLLVSVGSR